VINAAPSDGETAEILQRYVWHEITKITGVTILLSALSGVIPGPVRGCNRQMHGRR